MNEHDDDILGGDIEDALPEVEEEEEEAALDLDETGKKKKDLIDEDTVSLDDEAEDELDLDEDEKFDDEYDK